MYKVMMDGLVLYDSQLEEYALFNTMLELEVNKTGSFTFTIYPQHPLYDRVIQMQSFITVYQGNRAIFWGRVLNVIIGMRKDKKLEVEGVLGYLNDAVHPPYNFNGTVVEFIQSFIDNYNERNKPTYKFALGNVDVTTSTDTLIRSSIEYTNAFDELSSKTFKSNLGGYMTARVVDTTIFIDYLTDSPYISNQVVRFGENMLDIVESKISQELITGIIPVGARLEDENGEETDERLTIESINDGKDYLINQDAADKYGYIFVTQTWDDVTLPENLIQRGQDELIARSSMIPSFEVSAVDLSLIDIDVDSIDVFEYLKIVSEPHNIDENALILGRSIDIVNPVNNSFTFGFLKRGLVDDTLETEKVVTKINSDYVVNETVSNIRDDMTLLESSIDQTAEEIRSEVSKEFTSKGEFDEYKEFISSEFVQSAEGFDMLFNEMREYIDGLDGDSQKQFQEIIKYIRFVNGTIILGEVNNPLTVEISNDRVSFKQNGFEVAYISNNILYITDGNFTNSLRIGSFIFRPRSNGSLSFGRVN